MWLGVRMRREKRRPKKTGASYIKFLWTFSERDQMERRRACVEAVSHLARWFNL
jgi:hypothetical protein